MIKFFLKARESTCKAWYVISCLRIFLINFNICTIKKRFKDFSEIIWLKFLVNWSLGTRDLTPWAKFRSHFYSVNRNPTEIFVVEK